MQETEAETSIGILSRKGFNKGNEVLGNSSEELELSQSGGVIIAVTEGSGLLLLLLLLSS